MTRLREFSPAAKSAKVAGCPVWWLAGLVVLCGACLNPRPEELPSSVNPGGTPDSVPVSSNPNVPAPTLADPEEPSPAAGSPGLSDPDSADAGGVPDAGAADVSPPDAGAPAVE